MSDRAAAKTQDQGKAERIAKVIARAGVCSRREAEKLIGEGRVAVNGAVLASPAFTVTPADAVTVDIYNIAGQKVHGASFNGPPGVVNGKYAYEFLWDGRIPSGVYLYAIKAEKNGQGALRAAGKFAVVR